MIIKNFISEEEAKELLTLIEATTYLSINSAAGTYAEVFQIKDGSDILASIIQKVRDELNIHDMKEDKFCFNFMVQIRPGYNLDSHMDPCPDGHILRRASIQLVAPEQGGNVEYLDINERLDVGDLLFIDATLPHAISRIEGKKALKTLVLGFIKEK